MFTKLTRVLKFAVQDIYRNFSLSFMTILILVLMFLSVDTLLLIRVITFEATSSIRNQVDVSIYFNHKASDKQVAEVTSFLQSFPEIKEIKLLNRDDVLALFKEQNKDNPEIMASLSELNENPLGPTLVVKTRATNDYKKIISALNVPEYENIIESKTFADTEKAIEKINVITSNLEKFIVALSFLFALIAFIIIFNTIRVSIYSQRIEISIKKLVGATNWFVRGPYVVESVIFTILSVVVATGFFFTILSLIEPYIRTVFNKSSFLTNYFTSNIILLFGVELLAAFALTAFSSYFAMRKYLRS